MPPVTVSKTLGTQTIKLTFKSQAQATEFTDAAVACVRDSTTKMTHAGLMTSKAYVAMTGGQLAHVNGEFVALMKSYFRLGDPTSSTEYEKHKEALKRISELLQVVLLGFTRSDLEISYLEDAECSKGYKGKVMPTVSEAAAAYLTSDTHSFAGTKPLTNPILIDYQFLTRNYRLALNTMIHEATHKFCWTWDHAYFGQGGKLINADVAWYENIDLLIRMEGGGDNAYFRATSSKDRTRSSALSELKRVMVAANDKAGSKKVAADALDRQFEAYKADLEQKASRAGKSAFETEAVKTLTPIKALNNADSFSCFIVDMPYDVIRAA